MEKESIFRHSSRRRGRIQMKAPTNQTEAQQRRDRGKMFRLREQERAACAHCSCHCLQWLAYCGAHFPFTRKGFRDSRLSTTTCSRQWRSSHQQPGWNVCGHVRPVRVPAPNTGRHRHTDISATPGRARVCKHSRGHCMHQLAVSSTVGASSLAEYTLTQKWKVSEREGERDVYRGNSLSHDSGGCELSVIGAVACRPKAPKSHVSLEAAAMAQ